MSEEFSGVSELIEKLRRIAETLPNRVGVAIYAEALIEMAEAKRRTPIDTGELKASGFVNKPEYSGRDVSVTLQFGGPSVGYAVYVHENLEANHPHGQAKYLESTLLESAPYLAERIAKRLDFEGGVTGGSVDMSV